MELSQNEQTYEKDHLAKTVEIIRAKISAWVLLPSAKVIESSPCCQSKMLILWFSLPAIIKALFSFVRTILISSFLSLLVYF